MKRKLDWTLPGNIVPPMTPFDAEGKVDYAALGREIDYVIDSSHPAAICVAGVEAQEYQYLREDERRTLIRETVAFIGGRVPALVGVSHASFRASIELAELASNLGASAAQVLIPNRPSGGAATTAEVVNYFEAIASETSLPIVAYHNQGPGGDLSVSALVELTSLDAVVAMKESSRNQRFLCNLMRDVQQAGRAHVFTTLEVLLGTMILGASGGTMPPPGSAIAYELVEAFRSGDLARAVRAQQLLSEFPARWIADGLVAVSKAGLKAIGVDCGDTYPPFGSVSERNRAEIATFWGRALEAVPSARPGVPIHT